MKLQTAKGVRDSPPQEQIVRQRIVDTIKRGFELYGFLPLDTPVIERLDVLSSKYAGGDEILKETFKMVDQGNRELCLRYDLTVPMCRFVGMNPNLKMPFKRYQMGPVFRDGPIKLGRYREFWQIDADIVGAKGMSAEAELINMSFSVFRDLGMDVVMEVNNRKLLDGLLLQAGVQEDKLADFILSIDKLKKIGDTEVMKELKQKNFKDKVIADALASLKVTGTNEAKLKLLKGLVTNSIGKEGVTELESLLSLVEIPDLEFIPSLARGLSYYTGTVFEMFFKDSKIKSSCAGGGRYDNMISQFLESKQKYPAVGISFGIEVIKDSIGETDSKGSIAKVFIIPIGTEKVCMRIAKDFREAGIPTDLDVMGRGISKNLNYANTLSIPYVIIAGEDELKQAKVTLRDMSSGDQKLLSVPEAIEKVRVSS